MGWFKKIKVNTDRVLGLSAMLVSLLSLIFFIYQTNIMRDQSRLSVKPRLVFNTSIQSNDSLLTFSLLLQNKGLGPPIIKDANIVFESEIFPLDFDFFLDYHFPDLEKYGDLLSTSSLNSESIISVDEVRRLFVFRANLKDIQAINQYMKLNQDDYVLPWDIQLTYGSLYEEDWKMNYKKVKKTVDRK